MADIVIGLMLLALLGLLGFGVFIGVRSGLQRLYSDTRDPQQLARISMIVKGTLTIILCLTAIVPLTMVQELATEREGLYRDVVRDIGQAWGDEQLLSGPVLVIPYRYAINTEETHADGSRHTRKSIAEDELLILPNTLTMQADLQHEFRDRGIYHSLVYRTGVQGQAGFNINLPIVSNLESFEFDRARLVFGVSSNQAIDTVDLFRVSGLDKQPEQSLMPGTGIDQAPLARGFSQPVQLTGSGTALSVDFQLTLRGSRGLGFLPLGEDSRFDLSADWPHPSFTGSLPGTRDIHANGFRAHWQISHLSRNYPQIMRVSAMGELREGLAYTQLYEPVTHYGKIVRAIKYGLLFIALTFTLLLMFELSQGLPLSTLQYLMVGAAMTLFFLLLLALSEHLSFGVAYLLASAMPLISIPIYIASATQSRARGLLMALMLLGLYALLYSILHLEDYALLMGSGLLMTVLLVLMYLTRRQQPLPAQ